MITEDDLRSSLRALEQLAPDPAPVAERIHAGVRTRHRRRTAAVVVAAAGTAVAVALPVAVLDPAPAPAPAAPATTSRPAPRPTPQAVRFDPLAVPFTVGWLPAGWRPAMTYTRADEDSLEFEGPRADATMLVTIGRSAPSGPRRADGSPGGTGLRRRVGDVWVSVSGTSGKDVLSRVLASVRATPQPLTFPFRLTWVPPGYRVRAADSGAHHWLGNAAGNVDAAVPPLLDSGVILDTRPAIPSNTAGALMVSVSLENGITEDKGLHPDATFLGRPSRYIQDENRLSSLDVYGLHGMHVSLYADSNGRPELTRAVLERVAAGIRFTANPTDTATWTRDPMP